MDYKQIAKDWINAKNNIHYTEFKENSVMHSHFVYDSLTVCIRKGLFRKIKVVFKYDDDYDYFWVSINNIKILNINNKGNLNWEHSEPKEIIDTLNYASAIIINDTLKLKNKKTVKQIEYEQLCKILR